MKNTILINEEDISGEYNLQLIEVLKKCPQLIFGNRIIFSTNYLFRHPIQIIQMFNIYLKRLRMQGSERIMINLK